MLIRLFLVISILLQPIAYAAAHCDVSEPGTPGPQACCCTLLGESAGTMEGCGCHIESRSQPVAPPATIPEQSRDKVPVPPAVSALSDANIPVVTSSHAVAPTCPATMQAYARLQAVTCVWLT